MMTVCQSQLDKNQPESNLCTETKENDKMEIRIIIDKISGQSFVQNPELSDPHLIKMKNYVEIIEKEYNITPISLERYRNTMDAMKRIPPAYFNIFQALSAAGNLGELLIKRNIIGSEKLMQHVIEVSKDKDHHITVTDVERCCHCLLYTSDAADD